MNQDFALRMGKLATHSHTAHITHISRPSRVSVTFLFSSHNGKEVGEENKQRGPLRLLWNWHIVSLMWRLRRGSS